MPLTITDHTGLLSSNPADWPEALKREIARCCCTGSSSSSVIADASIACCPTRRLPTTLFGNIRSTAVHDTGLVLKHFSGTRVSGDPALDRLPPGFTREMLPNVPSIGSPDIYFYNDAWISDVFQDFECSFGPVEGLYQEFGFPISPPPSPYRIEYKYRTFFYVVLGWHRDSLTGVWNEFDYGWGIEPTPACELWIFYLCYPQGTLWFKHGLTGVEYTEVIDYRVNQFTHPGGMFLYPPAPLGSQSNYQRTSAVISANSILAGTAGPIAYPIPLTCDPFLLKGNFACSPAILFTRPMPLACSELVNPPGTLAVALPGWLGLGNSVDTPRENCKPDPFALPYFDPDIPYVEVFE